LSKVNVTLYEEETRLAAVKTDAKGVYNFKLKPNTRYRLEASFQDFQPETRSVVVDRQSDIKLTIDLQLQPVKNILAERNLDNIYFDFDKFIISQEAHEILDKLAIFMQENPSIRIGISSYTDAVGTSSYNKILSEKRVKATKEYLMAQGITSDRLSITASGEENLLVESPLGSKQKIRRNRRSEFRILKN
jgi:outer membrane protein OmpA-like peptidoglycan-associated protein